MSEAASLSINELRQFGEKGYVVVRNVISAEALAAGSRAIDRLVRDDPPAPRAIGQYYYWVGGLHAGPPDDSSGIGVSGQGIIGRREATVTAESGSDVRAALREILHDTPVASLAKSLCAVPALEVAFDQAQVALSIPRFLPGPGAGHIDGCEFNERGQPGSFSILVGVLMSDQTTENSGNLWVWPGTHVLTAAYFRKQGPEAIVSCESVPPIELPEPTQILGRAGDVVFAHYLLNHNSGGNYQSTETRRCIYYRLRRLGHLDRWRDAICDETLEFDGARDALRKGGV